MELNKSSDISGLTFGDIEKSPSSQHLFVEVVMIDKSHDLFNPLLYQIRSDAFLEDQEEFSDFGQKSFLPDVWSSFSLLGEVLFIDKEKKQIYATNEISVTYRHLIVASGLEANDDDDLSRGLHALLEALRVRKNVSYDLFFSNMSDSGFQQEKSPGLSHHAIPNKNIPRDVTKILSLKPAPDSLMTLDMVLAKKDMRFYEIQLSRKSEGGL